MNLKKLLDALGAKVEAEPSPAPEKKPEAPAYGGIALAVDEADIPKAKVLVNRLIDLFQKEAIAPDGITMLALAMLITEHGGGQKVGLEKAKEILATKSREVALGSGKTDKDGNPIFMAPQPKMMQ